MQRFVLGGLLTLCMAGCASQAVSDAEFEQQATRISQLAQVAREAGLDVQFNFSLNDRAGIYWVTGGEIRGPIEATGSMKGDFARPPVPGND